MTHRRGRWLVGALVVTAVTAVVATGAVRVDAAAPYPSLRAVPSAPAAALAAAALPWPAAGESAVAVPALGLVEVHGATTPVPVASLTKIMTAYLVLRDHPLGPDAPGPTVTVVPGDVADAGAQAAVGATTVPVTAGEELTERQLLDGLLVRSANNFADILARWDAGSVAAFVADMNRTAAALSLRATHYADPSGIDPASVSSAGDLARLSGLAMAVPSFATVVAQPAVTLPGAGTLLNYVGAVGHGGVVGVKSGFTQAAMGCLVLASEPRVGGRRLLTLAVVTGQPGWDPLTVAQQADTTLLGALASQLRAETVVRAGATVGRLAAPWAAPVAAATAAPVSLVVGPGQAVRTRLVPAPLGRTVRAGQTVARLVVTDGAEQVTVPVRARAGLGGPSWRWRLLHG